MERQELEVAPVLESDQRVVREPARVLAAGRDGETALAVLGRSRGELRDDEDEVIETADHVATRQLNVPDSSASTTVTVMMLASVLATTTSLTK